MKTRLLADNVSEFREHFGTLHDGVIHQVCYDIFTRRDKLTLIRKPTVFTVVTGTRDWLMKSDDKWVNLIFEVEEVSKVVVKKSPDYSGGIISGLSIGFFDDNIYLDFYGRPDTETEDDLGTFEDFDTGVELIVVGARCFWYITEYKER